MVRFATGIVTMINFIIATTAIISRSNNTIDSIVALLAGDLGVGQQLPMDYGVYNVPMAYRDRYYDTPDSLYRYNDGYIYQADAKTQLITAVISALV